MLQPRNSHQQLKMHKALKLTSWVLLVHAVCAYNLTNVTVHVPSDNIQLDKPKSLYVPPQPSGFILFFVGVYFAHAFTVTEDPRFELKDTSYKSFFLNGKQNKNADYATNISGFGYLLLDHKAETLQRNSSGRSKAAERKRASSAGGGQTHEIAEFVRGGCSKPRLYSRAEQALSSLLRMSLSMTTTIEDSNTSSNFAAVSPKTTFLLLALPHLHKARYADTSKTLELKLARTATEAGISFGRLLISRCTALDSLNTALKPHWGSLELMYSTFLLEPFTNLILPSFVFFPSCLLVKSRLCRTLFNVLPIAACLVLIMRLLPTTAPHAGPGNRIRRSRLRANFPRKLN